MRPLNRWAAAYMLLLAGCGGNQVGAAATPADAPRAGETAQPRPAPRPACDPNNGGLQLPQGFCAITVATGFAPEGTNARHLAVAPNGTVYVAVQGRRGAETPSERGAVVALRDADGDGRAEQRATFGPEGGTGVAIRDGHLFFATNSAVLRYRLGEGLEPVSGPDTVVSGLSAQRGHTAKSIALGANDELWVNIGSVSNVCQSPDRTAGVRGSDPCTETDTTAGVWLFSASRLRQRQADGQRWATGIRNAVALAYNPVDGTPYAVQHGRDQLNLWPGFSEQDNAEAPAEEFQRLTRGADFGWPYCYYDTRLRKRVLGPEYGGNGREVGRCAGKQDPIVAFPGHWAPNGLLFYTGSHFPARYRGGAFIAFHGSWNRAPLPQAGYKVAFVPFRDGQAQEYEVFADGFAGSNPQPGTATHRPMGLAEGPDGSLYLTSSRSRTVWRIFYTGAGPPQPLRPMHTIHLRTTERCQLVEITDRLQEVVSRSGVREGVLFAQSLHTTAGLTVNENADPDVQRDLVGKLGRMIPRQEPFYRHAEGNSDSHLKTSMMGPGLSVLVSGGRLVLGTWQGVFFCEWDGPRERQVAVQLLRTDG